jgi:hypothetical protein
MREPNIGWTLLGWINLIALLLLGLAFVGIRPTLWTILGGTGVFLTVSVLLVWVAFRRR